MREQQTLGRRIQEARKAAGLSQESLGERLGVSRQAVSKWEADAAVPELENLIAMSRIFGVTIGALLGVEPEAAEDRSEKDAPEAPGERRGGHRPGGGADRPGAGGGGGHRTKVSGGGPAPPVEPAAEVRSRARQSARSWCWRPQVCVGIYS